LNFGLCVDHDIAPCWWISKIIAAISCTKSSPRELFTGSG
jgi:hypothetical protein